MKLYIIKQGTLSGANSNSISILMNPKASNQDSLRFVARVVKKMEELGNLTCAQNTHINLNYGVTFRFKSLETNKLLAKKLIKLVELEDDFKKLYKTEYKKFIQPK